MKIIEKIEIKHFRSFDGGLGQENVEIEKIGDLNIFSGANDSGKSNVLRAINLFFNDEISHGVKFDIERDFSKIVDIRFDKTLSEKQSALELRKKESKEKGEENKESYKKRSDTQVVIKIHFYNPNNQRGLGKKFWISKIFSSKNNFEGSFNYQGNLNKAQATLFRKSFQFEYVPAIKDRGYFQYLFGKLQKHLLEKKNKIGENKFKDSSDNLSSILTEETKALFEKFEETSGVNASFNIPDSFIDFFRKLSVETENGISLYERGDGIQARFIPDILEEISSDDKKNIIWGFEEPENSYESKNIRKLRDNFLNLYSRSKQIFITTHTKEFLSLERGYTKEENNILSNKKISNKIKDERLEKLSIEKSSSDISIYRVWKNLEKLEKVEKNVSLITRFDQDKKVWEDICDDLGIGIVNESQIIEKLQLKISDQSNLLKEADITMDQKEKITKELMDERERCLVKLNSAEEKIEEYKKPILYVEDKYDQVYKIAYLKLNDIDCDESNFEEKFKVHSPFTIKRAEGAGSLGGILRSNNTDLFVDKKILGLFDFDKEGRENFHYLSKDNYWKTSSAGGIRENILGDKETGFYKKREDHPHFYAMLLPIPDRLLFSASLDWSHFVSYVEIENLLPRFFLESNNFVDKKIETVGEILKIKNCKKTLWKKLFSLTKEDFVDLKLIFNKIDDLF